MKYFLRPVRRMEVAAAGVALVLLCTPPGAVAQLNEVKHLVHEMNPLISHSSAQGYLGVLVGDVDSEAAGKLKLKDARGAVVTLIDHDAPAGQAGLRVNDVILSINGQTVENAEHFGRILREFPAGRKVTLAVSRDGAQQEMTIQLVDRKVMEQAVWNKMNKVEDDAPPAGNAILSGGGGGGDALPGFHMPWFSSGLNVGAMVEPLTSQMADYLGVPNGIMVKQVAHRSEAAVAGLKAYDVVLRVGSDSMNTTADWDRALRANRGKPVQITILRERKQQTLNLQVDSKRK